MATVRPLALVTGGWRRIGAAIARALAADGWDLALHAHHADGVDQAFADELRGVGAAVEPLSGDLAESGVPESLIDRCSRAPSLLVNSASIFRDDRLATLTAESLDAHMRVNLYAPLLLTSAFAARLSGEPGCVVMLLDSRVRNPVPDQLAYSLSKQALHAGLRNLARDLAPAIRVNGVAPGLILPTSDYDDAQWDRLTALMPLERLPTPAEIAHAVVWLARAPSVTGHSVTSCGTRAAIQPRLPMRCS